MFFCIFKCLQQSMKRTPHFFSCKNVFYVNATSSENKVLLYLAELYSTPSGHKVTLHTFKFWFMLCQNASRSNSGKPWAFIVFQNSSRLLAVRQTHTHRLTDVGQRDPQREDDGEEEEIREALTAALGPRQAQGLIFFIVFITLFEKHKVELSWRTYTHTPSPIRVV